LKTGCINTMKNFSLLVFLVLFLCTVSLSTYALDSDGLAAALISEKKIKDKIAEVKDTKVLDDEFKNNLLSVYSKILDNLDTIKSYQAQTAKYKNLIKKAPDEIKKLKKEIAQAEQKNNKPVYSPGELNKLDLLELQQRLNSESANLTALETRFTGLKQTLERESSSAENIRKQLVDANHKLELLLDEKNQPQSGISDEQKRANQWLVRFGDLRIPDVDSIDWVESIPFRETRNYVKKVMRLYRTLQGQI